MSIAETPRERKILLGWAVLLVLGAAGWLVVLVEGDDPARAWRALLVNYIYFTPLAAALVTWSAIVIAANGHWAGPAERLAWTGLGFSVPSLVLLLVLWAGAEAWIPWYGDVLHQGIWLDTRFLFLRDLAALIVFWGAAGYYLNRRRTGRQTSMAAASALIAVYAVVFSLIGFDLVMAMNPAWRSTVFGAYFFISALYIGIAFWTLLITARPDSPEPLRNDFANLIITFCILTTYFFYMQLLTIWYENMPHETQWLIPRMNDPSWSPVSLLIVAVLFFGPVILLLTTKAKRSRFFLMGVSILLLIVLWVERWWLIEPNVSPEFVFGLEEITSTAAVLALLALGIRLTRNRLPPVPAEQEASG